MAADRGFRYSEVMANVVNPRSLPGPKVFIPGLKPPVRDFAPSDDGDPSEVDAFNKMIRELRHQSPAAPTDRG
jgi:hypothetical protein